MIEVIRSKHLFVTLFKKIRLFINSDKGRSQNFGDPYCKLECSDVNYANHGKQDTLVSIIVPAYNVEKYIRKCINSIQQQTHRNIEILIVDDGGEDNTPKIIDKLASSDNRIRIIHKENEGVSIARNIGIERAKGEYIVFVDADDYLDENFVDYMLSLANKDDADFVFSKQCHFRENDIQTEDSIVTITPAEATALLISPSVIVGCWNKMFRKSFLDRICLRFSTNLFYGEGLKFITDAAQRANCITIGHRKVYYYRRDNEMSATSKYNIKKYFNGEKALSRIEEELIIRNKNIEVMMMLHKSMFCLGAVSQTYAQKLQKEHKDDCDHWLNIIRSYLPYILKSKQVSLYRKLLILGGFLFPGILCKLDMRRRKQIAKNSVE